jgi:DNA-binding transcriptional MerR regulator
MVTREPTINLSLEELSSEVALLLEEYSLLGAQQDHRVSASPDVRTIRYYTTLGLLDRPSMEGRQARYGRRHLLQLLAIKALQGISLPLSQVQARLYGRSDEELEHLLANLAVSQQRKSHTQEMLKPITWKEIVIEPGLKIMVQEGWSPGSVTDITDKVSAVLLALNQTPPRSDGGKEDDQPDK